MYQILLWIEEVSFYTKLASKIQTKHLLIKKKKKVPPLAA